MAKSSERTTKSQMAHCRTCNEDFLTYNTVASTECPFCGRRVRPARQKWLLIFVAVLLVAAALAGGALAFWPKG